MAHAPFDGVPATELNLARLRFLETLLTSVKPPTPIATVLDAGCGFGFFADHLQRLGFQVTAFDGRSTTIEEARQRHPGVHFLVADVEDETVRTLGLFDLVICFGLLYHLENPLRAVRNLAAVTGTLMVVETVVAPAQSPATILYEEDRRDDQGLTYLSSIPTESWLVKCLYRVGFQCVYRVETLPHHPDFRSSFFKRKRRAVLIASKSNLSPSILRLVHEPHTVRHLWDPSWLNLVGRSEKLRQVLKSVFGTLTGSNLRDDS